MKPLVKIILFSFIALFLSGCTTTKNLPPGICPPDALVAPLFVAPSNNGYAAGPTATLQWSFPDVFYPANSGSYCRPEKFRLTLKKGPLYVEAMGAMVDGNLNSWVTPPLEAGAEYLWSVAAMTDNTNGPFSGIWKFHVGESCGIDPVLAPTLLQPFNGATLNYLIPTLVWDNNDDCIPEGYHIDIATDPGFVNIINSINTSSASLSYPITSPMTNCTRFYWRVAGFQGSNVHPYSETFSFRVATEGCEAEPGAGSINGKVWQDMCPLNPGDILVEPMPVGCIESGDGYSANGMIEPGEPGISDVVVRIGAGTCGASMPLGLTFTNIDGNYFLWGLQAGTYCINIDSGENPIWLGNGWWTHPPEAVGNSNAEWEIVLATDEDKAGVNFGWQFENGGANPYGLLEGYIFHDICSVPHGVGYSGPIPAGCVQHDGWVTGNWHHEEGEPGIPGVTVNVRKLNCSNPIYQSTITDESGIYSFLLEPGIAYCMEVDSMSPANFNVLQPGVWSRIPNEPVYRIPVITFPWEGAVYREYIGWDYSNLLSPILEIEIPILYPIFKPDFDINCRVGPDKFWQVAAKLKAGMKLPVMAINPNRDWLLLKPAGMLNQEEFPEFNYFDKEMTCWALRETGSTEGDLEKLKVEFGPRLPTATPTMVPVSCSGLSETTCKNTTGCKWVPSSVRLGYCTNE
jgi:hypothetical protein